MSKLLQGSELEHRCTELGISIEGPPRTQSSSGSSPLTGHLAEQGRELPDYVHREIEDYLKCGRLEHGFLRVRCESCHAEHLLAFSCKRRGFCPSCGARRMSQSAALLVDEVLPEQPMRQWVLSFPFQLRFLFASRPEIMGRVLGIVYRVIATHLVKKTGYTHQAAKTGAVTLIQRFGSALNLNIHLTCMDARMPRAHGCAGAAHMLFLDGVYVDHPDATARFRWVKAPTSAELTQLAHTIAHRVGTLSGAARPTGTGCRKQLPERGCGG